ncbi:hypothetical protein KC573_03480 [candidate division WWE3 bacterium]|uniref:Uncharacterized protein n=1 Tax=candidate division WWE3 bacterium TaxID=2053526 RepID=A0A955LWK1_UNCKA|nr:hypothetical protein [candidate division WWE3 bacterium]
MAFFSSHIGDTTTFEKAKDFFITSTKQVSNDFSVTYIDLNDNRDPEEEDKLIAINKGFSAIYVGVEGVALFTFYEGDEQTEVVLQPHEYVYITPGTKYEIVGKCRLMLISLPAYTDKMFSHPEIQ